MIPKIFTIAPHAPFLRTLVKRVLDGTLLGDWPQEGPFWLSDVTIILPTRRAADQLALSFAEAMGGGALLPDIRTFGGESEDEEPFLPPHDLVALPTAVPPVSRRLLLSELVSQWLKKNPNSPLAVGGVPNPVQVLSLSDSLATLIDDFTTEQVDPHSLRDLQDRELTDYWKDSLDFLGIALDAWPQLLAGQGKADSATLRNSRLKRQAETAPLLYGDRPVIAAGSTGSIPATAELMRQVARLPRGALVLPGLDRTLSAKSLAQLRDQARAPHGHAQYHLVHLLDGIRAQPEQVEELAIPESTARTQLVRRALDLADETAHWHEARSGMPETQFAEALRPLSIAAAHGEQEQAAAVALASLDALKANKRVGIIAPDRNLARRIVTELMRFDIQVDDSAGTPLHQSRTGRLVRQVMALARSRFGAVDLMALLRNRYVTLGRSRAAIADLAQRVEFGLLRGQHLAPDLVGLRAMLRTNLTDAKNEHHFAHKLTSEDETALLALFADLEMAMTPLTSLLENPFRTAELAAALCATLTLLRQPAPDETRPDLPGVNELTRWEKALAESFYPGPMLDSESAEPALPQLMAGFSVRAREQGDPRISIWGRLEARLQPADLMILTALNEGTWPEVADPGPWLNRQMRLGVGLEPPERLHGLAAHDFEMALGAPEVLLTYAERVGTSPATPSRLLQRLTAFVGEEATNEMRARGQYWVQAARRIDLAPHPPQPALRPEPAPPAGARTRRISVTQVEKLFRSPYDLYASGTLKLHALEPLGTEAGARERGTFIHDVFARFVQENGDPFAPDAHEMLIGMAQETFAQLETIPERRDIWLKRFERSAEKYLAFERERAGRVTTRFAEQKLGWTFPVAGEDFILHGRADRVDLMQDGTVEIIDFKTGAVPAPKEMQNYLAPQMLLEALMVQQAGFTTADDQKIAPASSSALTYIQLGASPKAFEEKPFSLPKDVGMDDALTTLHRLLEGHLQLFLLNEGQPMMAGLMPKSGQRFAGDFDHLSRLKEWTGEAGEEAE